jgi:hypothetical protein
MITSSFPTSIPAGIRVCVWHVSSLLLVTIVALSLGINSRAAAGDLPNAPPDGWWWYYGQTPEQVGSLLTTNKARLMSIQVEQTSPLLFTVAMVQNTGAYAKQWWWFYGQSETDIANHAKQLNARVVSLDAYQVGNSINFAAVFISNTSGDAKSWWWYYGQTPAQIGTLLKQHNARLIDLRQYPFNGSTQYAAVMVENTGADATAWWWFFNIGASQVSSALQKNGAYLTSLQVADRNAPTFNVIMNKLPTPGSTGWWWYFGENALQVTSLYENKSAWLRDVKTYSLNGQRVFTALLLGLRPPDSELYRADVLTQHNDNSRSGAYLVETQLTPQNVASPQFGRVCTRNVDGDTVSQPLYMRGVHTVAAGVKNLFFVTTSKNNVYAFDLDNADSNPAHGLVWNRNLCPSKPTSVCGETWSRLVGITSTPVIDPDAQTMYAVARCSDPTGGANDGAIFIHSIKLADGTDRVPPVQVVAKDPGNPGVTFDLHCQRQRPGLLLSAGVVYAAFATFSCDAGCANAPYHGWVLGYRASDLKQVAVFDTSPHQGQVGIWQTGNGLAGTDDGSIFFQTGNGPSTEALQDSFVKLALAPPPAGLTFAGSFGPDDAATLASGDTDLGSGGPMLLPYGRLIGGGKQGRYYVLDQGSVKLTQDTGTDSLGYNGFQAFFNTYHADKTKPMCAPAPGAAGCNTSDAGGVCFVDPKSYANGELCGPNIHWGPIYWQTNPSFGLIYGMPEKDFLKAFKYDLTTHLVTEAPFLTATGSLAKPPTDGMPGGFSSLSANNTKDGIVWTSMPFGDGQWNPVPGRIAAFDASTLKQLWSDNDNVLFAKSVPPTIADGKVIRATAANQVIVYGLSKAQVSPGLIRASQPRCYSIEEKYANYGGEAGLLGMPTAPQRSTGDQVGGTYRDYRSTGFGRIATLRSKQQHAGAPIPTCSEPTGETVTVDSSIYGNPKTCAHVVQGQIRDLWLQLGGTKSKLGYPIADETLTTDAHGRMSTFEHGEIDWYPDKGASVR